MNRAPAARRSPRWSARCLRGRAGASSWIAPRATNQRRFYQELLQSGVAVIAANKRAFAGPPASWQGLCEAARHGLLLHEATVGAGLPILSTLADLVATGDTVTRIEGCLSGTIAFLMSRLGESASFSEAVREAHGLGYTEPDPREDLGGVDAGRKLLILARVAGLPAGEVQVECLLPGRDWNSLSQEQFWAALPELDEHYRELARVAGPRTRRLSFVASASEAGLEAGLRLLDESHPCFSLSGTQNLIAFWTRRYAEAPLVVRGPGAGPGGDGLRGVLRHPEGRPLPLESRRSMTTVSGVSGVGGRIPVAILGATGSVGQRFVSLLANHPWFKIAHLTASERSAGKPYGEAVRWLQQAPLPREIAAMPLLPTEPFAVPLAFSAMDAAAAGPAEAAFARAGVLVVSNAKSHRYDADVPLLVPEVNAEHLAAASLQQYGTGAILTNPNCSTIGIVLALKPIADAFGLRRVHVVTLQAVSGAGLPGVPSFEILDNVIPYIADEEEKIERETLKILGGVRRQGLQGREHRGERGLPPGRGDRRPHARDLGRDRAQGERRRDPRRLGRLPRRAAGAGPAVGAAAPHPLPRAQRRAAAAVASRPRGRHGDEHRQAAAVRQLRPQVRGAFAQHRARRRGRSDPGGRAGDEPRAAARCRPRHRGAATA